MSLLQEIIRKLSRDGYPLDEERRQSNCRIAPGISVRQYMETLRTFDRVESRDGATRFVYRCPYCGQ